MRTLRIGMVALLFMGVGQNGRLAWVKATEPGGGKRVVQCWNKVAANRKVPSDVVHQVDNMLDVGFSQASPIVTDARLKLLETELPDLLDSCAFSSKQAEDRVEASNWISYCIVRAFSQKELTNGERAKIIKGNEAFVQKVSDTIKSTAIAALPAEQRARWTPSIVAGIKQLRAQCLAQVQTLSNSFLYPAMKESLTDEQKAFILSHYNTISHYPQYTDPPQLMMTKDECYKQKLESTLNGMSHDFCFWYSTSQISEDSTKPTWWGELYFGAVGSDVKWRFKARIGREKAPTSQPRMDGG